MPSRTSIEEAIMRKFSVRPTLTLRGRTFKGLRGWSGKPFHPPLTDFPIVCYVLAAAFDVISVVAGEDHNWAREMWHAGTYTFIAGAAVSVLAAADIAWRLNDYHTHAVAPVGIAILSVIVAALVGVGATFGGSLVFEYGFNVETAGDSPVWHKSETDVFPGPHGQA